METTPHVSQAFKTGEGKLTLATIIASALALVADNVQAVNLDGMERKVVLAGLFGQAMALTIARGLAKLRPPTPPG